MKTKSNRYWISTSKEAQWVLMWSWKTKKFTWLDIRSGPRQAFRTMAEQERYTSQSMYRETNRKEALAIAKVEKARKR